MDPHSTQSAVLPIVLQATVCAAMLAAWIGLHRLRRGKRPWAIRAAMAARVAVGAVAWWLAIELLGRLLSLNAGWGQGVVALVGAAAVEAIVVLSARERETVRPKVARRLLALRITLAVLVLLMLLQPVLNYDVRVRRERYVAVLLDASASMDLTDPQADASEKLQRARLYRLPFAKANRLEAAPRQLASLRQEFETQWGALAAIATNPESAAAALQRRRDPAVRALDRARQEAEAFRKDLTDAMEGPARDDKTRPALQAARDRLDQVMNDVAQARKLAETEPAAALASALEPLRAQWRKVIEGLQQLEGQARPLAALVDQATVAALDAGQKQDLDKLAAETRGAIARRVLLDAPSGQPPLVDALAKDHPVRLYRFAAKPEAADLNVWRSSGEDAAAAGKPPSEWRQATDLAAAMAQTQQEIPADQLAGVVIVSDGRHNYGAPAEPLARRLGQAGVPVCSVVVGSTLPPRDAALIDASCPETVFLKDKVTINAQVRAIGMGGLSLVVRLLHGGTVVDQKTVAVTDDDFRTLVPLGHTPREVGMHSYRIELEPPSKDFVQENNHLQRQVAVTDARIKLLLVDDRPRWEFRYVRNLFAGRDKTVQLQHVLLMPDRLAGAPQRPAVPASASRPYGEFEATAVPRSPEEWLKFEAIVLGDVPPSVLDEKTVATLERFVGRQGGTLVVIAGPNAMPHAYTKTKLADLLPATFQPSAAPLYDGPEPAYRLALSPEGGAHMIMRVRANPTDNAATWNSLPLMDWRHPVQQLKPGATVLAYAEPDVGQVSNLSSDLSGKPARQVENLSYERRRPDTERVRLQRQNPLIVVQKYGAGNVLLLNFDRTWRLRYRVGDTYHHRFWSQVLRWATANKLAAGTAHVRVGTDRYRYQAGEPVLVRGQLLDEQDRPLTGEKVVASVWQDGRLVLKKTLAYVPDSPGVYQGDLGALPKAGTYQVELEGPAVASLLVRDHVDKVKTELAVTPLERTSEMVDVSADWRLPAQLADLSGGKAVGPADARSLVDLFTAKSKEVRERRAIALWDCWPMLLLALAAVSSEWILRKKAGLP